jgi:hypothetical protein
MKSRRIFSFLVFVSFLCFIFPEVSFSYRNNFLLVYENGFHTNYDFEIYKNFKNSSVFCPASRTVNDLTESGIKEDIPKKYAERFQKWKAEFTSTEFGQRQWDFYAGNKNFLLTVKISDDKKQGAKTDDYLWDDNGNFVGATIILGNKPEKGFPDPVYYPVMNSLASGDPVEGDVLAATKLAHEIGHVNQTFKENKESFELRNKLTPVYISIFLKNGHNTNDEKLVELAEQMGGTPMKIWESREYWSEVNAMLFLKEKISKEVFLCNVFGKIKNNVETYAKSYEERFGAMDISVCEK